MEDRKVLITGSGGFIGKRLYAALKTKNTVGTFDKKEGDIRNFEAVKKIEEVEVIFHLAAVASVPLSYTDPGLTYGVNVIGALNVLELCRLRDVEKLVFTSSYVYGKPEYLPIDENHPLNPTNPYARSKVLGEGLCRAYYEDYGIKTVILRPSNIYGEGQKGDFLIPTIVSQMIEEEKIILKDPEPKRDFLYVDDLIFAYIRGGNFKKTGFEIFNIGYGASYSVREIVEKVEGIYRHKTGKKIPIEFTAIKRKNEILDTVVDIKKAGGILNWVPKISIEEGLRKVVEDKTK